MGLAHANITLSNPRYPELKPLTVEALVDSGANWTCIPEHIAIQLRLDEYEKREVVVANDARETVPYVGPLLLQFENRNSLTGAMVLGSRILLGAIAMEDMDVIISPRDRRLIVNPANPNLSASFVGGAWFSRK